MSSKGSANARHTSWTAREGKRKINNNTWYDDQWVSDNANQWPGDSSWQEGDVGYYDTFGNWWKGSTSTSRFPLTRAPATAGALSQPETGNGVLIRGQQRSSTRPGDPKFVMNPDATTFNWVKES